MREKLRKFYILIFVLIIGFGSGCGSIHRFEKSVVRPGESTFLDVQYLGGGSSHGAWIGPSDFPLIFFMDLPFAFILDTVFIPKDLWDLQNNYVNHYDFLLSGTVVDSETGELLNDVNVNIYPSRSAEVYIYDVKSQKIKINKSFNLKFNNIEDLTLVFKKDNYNKKRICLEPNEKDSTIKPIDQKIELKNLKISLQRKSKHLNIDKD